MKCSRVRILTMALMAALFGCDDKPSDEAPPGSFGDGGPSGRVTLDGATDGATLGTGDGRDAPVSPLPEGVNITVNVTNPSKDAVVRSIDNFKPTVEIEVVADSMAGLEGVFLETVFAEVIVPNAAVPQVPVKLDQVGKARPGSEGKPETVFTFGDVRVPVSTLSSGNVMLKVTVTTNKGVVRTGEISFKIDAGPAITFIKPLVSEPFKNSAVITVTISDPVSPPVRDISIAVGDTLQMVKETEPGTYVATVDFKSFSPPLTGRQLVTVRAKNNNGTNAVASREFVADDIGPTFEMASPIKGQLIGNIIEISAVVNDPAGVDPASVVAVIGNGAGVEFEVRLNPPPLGAMSPKYSKLFDTKLLPANAIYPSLSFRARDTLGNESTEGYNLSLDNMPPLLDLDPPDDMRLLTLTAGEYFCSWPLDPVGPDAVDDGQYVNQAFDVRVRAEDQGNQVVSGSIDFIPIAGLKNVSLLALDDTTRALVVDTDSDGMCDALNPLLVPTSRPMSSDQILLLSMDPLPKSGIPDNAREVPEPATCKTDKSMAAVVEPLCGGAGATYNRSKARYGDAIGPKGEPILRPHSHYMSVFPGYTQDNLPAIWTLGPVRSGVECAGRQLESVGSNLTDGWTCLAAVGEDTLGLKQVSRPIRVCINHDGVGNDCPHQTIVNATAGSPIEVETKNDHGFFTGDEVFIQGIGCQTSANGKRKVTVNSPRTFTLNGVNGRIGVDPYLGCNTGLVVATKQMPDCTGTQTKADPKPEVDEKTKPCAPWRNFAQGEQRIFQ